jgi:predicted nucleic acid-binding protein
VIDGSVFIDAFNLFKIGHTASQNLLTRLYARAALCRQRGSDAVYAAAAQRFACPLISLDKEQHDRIAAVLRTFHPVDLLSEL